MGYLEHLQKTLQDMFGEIISQPKKKSGFLGGIFSSSVAVGDGTGQSGLQLFLRTTKITEDQASNFTVSRQDGTTVTYRSPSNIVVTFSLSGKDISTDDRVHYLESLNSFFFDNKAIGHIYPPTLDEIPVMGDKMKMIKSQIKILSQNLDYKDNSFDFTFEYHGPFHSGHVIGEGKIVTKKSLGLFGKS